MARLLVVNPGASYATFDVHKGYVRALREQGHTIVEYALDQRIDDANRWYRYLYRAKKIAGPPPPRLILTKAGSDIVSQALYHQVDCVLAISLMYLDPTYLVLVRRAGIPVAALLTEDPYDSDKAAKVIPHVDVAFTNERSSVAYLRRFNPNTHYLGAAYDPAISRPTVVSGDVPRHQVLFVGTLFEERINLFAGVDWSGIDFAIYGGQELLPSRHRLRKYVRGKIIPNHLTQQYYQAAAINVNSYRTSKGFGIGVEHIAHAESLNPRALELAACGAFSVSEPRAEVCEVFGRLVPTFAAGDSADLELVVRWYLEEAEEERHEIARALPAAVTGHTYAARAADMLATIAAAWPSRGRKAS